jgi:hypothetical protein
MSTSKSSLICTFKLPFTSLSKFSNPNPALASLSLVSPAGALGAAPGTPLVTPPSVSLTSPVGAPRLPVALPAVLASVLALISYKSPISRALVLFRVWHVGFTFVWFGGLGRSMRKLCLLIFTLGFLAFRGSSRRRQIVWCAE